MPDEGGLLLTRSEIGRMTDVALELAYSRTADKISNDWRRGAPGRLIDVYDLALLRLEADLRCLSVGPAGRSGQLTLPMPGQ